MIYFNGLFLFFLYMSLVINYIVQDQFGIGFCLAFFLIRIIDFFFDSVDKHIKEKENYSDTSECTTTYKITNLEGDNYVTYEYTKK